MELKITGSLVLDLGDYIHAVEATAGDYMLPNPQGWFLSGACEPVLDRSKQYFYAGEAQDSVARPIPIDFDQLRKEDIYDQQANVVVVKKQVQFLRDTPQYSPRSRNLIVEVIDHLIRNHSRWTGTQKRGVRQANINAAIRPFLLEQFQRSGISVDGVFQYPSDPNHPLFTWGKTGDLEGVQLDPVSDQGLARISEQDKELFYAGVKICESITLQITDLLKQLSDFLGQDRWIMHFMKVSNTTVTVERTIDYRIYSWMREHGRDYDD